MTPFTDALFAFGVQMTRNEFQPEVEHQRCLHCADPAWLRETRNEWGTEIKVYRCLSGHTSQIATIKL